MSESDFPDVLVLIVPFPSGLLSFFCHRSPAGPVVPVPLLPISTHEQLLAVAVGGAVVVVVIFSNSVSFHAICPASRGSQRCCHPCRFIALSSLSLTPSIPPYEQRLVAAVVRGCLVGCQSCCAVLLLSQRRFLFRGV